MAKKTVKELDSEVQQLKMIIESLKEELESTCSNFNLKTRTSRQGDIYKIHIHNRRYVKAMVLFPLYLEPDFASWGTHKAHNHIVIHFMVKMLSHVYCINGLPDVKLFLFDVSLFD